MDLHRLSMNTTHRFCTLWSPTNAQMSKLRLTTPGIMESVHIPVMLMSITKGELAGPPG